MGGVTDTNRKKHVSIRYALIGYASFILIKDLILFNIVNIKY